MFSILMFTICTSATSCQPPRRMSGPIAESRCATMYEKAQANLARNGYKHDRLACVPAGRQQVASK